MSCRSYPNIHRWRITKEYTHTHTSISCARYDYQYTCVHTRDHMHMNIHTHTLKTVTLVPSMVAHARIQQIEAEGLSQTQGHPGLLLNKQKDQPTGPLKMNASRIPQAAQGQGHPLNLGYKKLKELLNLSRTNHRATGSMIQ